MGRAHPMDFRLGRRAGLEGLAAAAVRAVHPEDVLDRGLELGRDQAAPLHGRRARQIDASVAELLAGAHHQIGLRAFLARLPRVVAALLADNEAAADALDVLRVGNRPRLDRGARHQLAIVPGVLLAGLSVRPQEHLQVRRCPQDGHQLVLHELLRLVVGPFVQEGVRLFVAGVVEDQQGGEGRGADARALQEDERLRPELLQQAGEPLLDGRQGRGSAPRRLRCRDEGVPGSPFRDRHGRVRHQGRGRAGHSAVVGDLPEQPERTGLRDEDGIVGRVIEQPTRRTHRRPRRARGPRRRARRRSRRSPASTPGCPRTPGRGRRPPSSRR